MIISVNVPFLFPCSSFPIVFEALLGEECSKSHVPFLKLILLDFLDNLFGVAIFRALIFLREEQIFLELVELRTSSWPWLGCKEESGCGVSDWGLKIVESFLLGLRSVPTCCVDERREIDGILGGIGWANGKPRASRVSNLLTSDRKLRETFLGRRSDEAWYLRLVGCRSWTPSYLCGEGIHEYVWRDWQPRCDRFPEDEGMSRFWACRAWIYGERDTWVWIAGSIKFDIFTTSGAIQWEQTCKATFLLCSDRRNGRRSIKIFWTSRFPFTTMSRESVSQVPAVLMSQLYYCRSLIVSPLRQIQLGLISQLQPWSKVQKKMHCIAPTSPLLCNQRCWRRGSTNKRSPLQRREHEVMPPNTCYAAHPITQSYPSEHHLNSK